jgi:flagellar hook-associated protein 2
MASGLPPNLVDMLIQAERKPIEVIEGNKANQEEKLKLVNELRTHIGGLGDITGNLKSFSTLRELKARASNEELLTVSVDKERAQPGVYTLQVEQLAKKASAMSNGFPDKDYTEVGIGWLEFEADGEEREIYIGEDNNTLEGVAGAINSSGLPVRASVVYDEGIEDEDERYKLIIATNNEGANQQFNFSNFYFDDGDQELYFDKESAASNGIIVLDGFPISITSNKLTDIIPGATVNLLDAKAGKNVSVIIEEDIEAVGDKVDKFVEKSNDVFKFFEKQFNIDADTDTSKTLAGDSGLQSLQFTLRRMFQDAVPGIEGRIKRFSDMGIMFGRGGILEFDKEKFLNAANEDFKGVSDVFGANRYYEDEEGEKKIMEGIASKLNTKSREVLYGNGLISLKAKGLKQRLRSYDQEIERHERRIVEKEKSLRRKFATLETTMSKLKAQQASMSKALGAMPSPSGGMFAGKMTASNSNG